MLQLQRNPSAPISGLPVPDESALAHSVQLTEYIKAVIESEGGAVSFSRFMELALYAPGLGYYSAGASKLGETGDFTTAPEISPIFSCCLARQCAQVLQKDRERSILELGAGTGRMAGDIMRELADIGNLPEEYFILEISADLRQRQQVFLRQYLPADSYDRLHWLEALPEGGFDGVVIANEVMDALPVERICYEQGKYHIVQVSLDQSGQFVWSRKLAGEQVSAQIDSVLAGSQSRLPDGYTTEINLLLSGWIRSLADTLRRGLILLIDYGYPRYEYYHPQRCDGTLICHFQHHAHSDPFCYVGLQDITASVDFTTVAEAAEAAGLSVSGYCPQAQFLLSCGLDELVNKYSDGEEQALLKLSGQVKQLLLPAEMGERFKVIALSREIDEPLLGFNILDHRERL